MKTEPQTRAPKLMDGLLLVDKAPNLTSFQVVKTIKRLLNVKKVGHTGTLDPIATGVLPICLGRATKLASIVMTYRKEYDVWARFGVATDTHDRTGTVTAERPWEHLKEEGVRQAMTGFVGEITQVPPMFSAIKYKGRPLYWYAHKGIVLGNRESRQCTIHSLELLEWKPPLARFKVQSSHGTYVRTLMHDLAAKLDSAATVEELRRTACGELTAERCLTLEQLEAMSPEQRWEQVLSMSQALPQLPDYPVNSAIAARLRAGRPIMWSDLRAGGPSGAGMAGQPAAALADDELFKITTPDGDLIAVAAWGRNPFQRDGDSVLANRVVRTVRIFGND